MILIACVDDEYGMLFNRRRQSSDREIRRKIAEFAKGKRLVITPYTKEQFHDIHKINFKICDNPLAEAKKNDIVFIENSPLSLDKKEIESIILFFWNRTYPHDTYFPKEELLENWKVKNIEEIEGFSHLITQKTFSRGRGEEEI